MQREQHERQASADDDWPLDAEKPVKRGASHFVTLALLLMSTAAILALGLFASADGRGFGTHEQLGLPPCQMMAMTGVPCPGCGVTTSVTLAAKGKASESLATQPLGLLLVLFVPLLTLFAVLLHVRGVDLYSRFEHRQLPWVRVFLALAAGAWIYKIVAHVTLGDA